MALFHLTVDKKTYAFEFRRFIDADGDEFLDFFDDLEDKFGLLDYASFDDSPPNIGYSGDISEKNIWILISEFNKYFTNNKSDVFEFDNDCINSSEEMFNAYTKAKGEYNEID